MGDPRSSSPPSYLLEGRYLAEKLVARGETADVFSGNDTWSGEHVAIRRLRSDERVESLQVERRGLLEQRARELSNAVFARASESSSESLTREKIGRRSSLGKRERRPKSWPKWPSPSTFGGMRMGNIDRRTAPAQTSCVVCSTTDARLLSTTTLEDGSRVTVCGSHKVAHQRAERIASTVDDLRLLLCDRRVANG